MATAKFVTKKHYVKKSGKTPIYLQYIFNSENKVLINTGFEIFPNLWNVTTQSVKPSVDFVCEKKTYAVVNAELSDLMAKFKAFLSSTLLRNQIPNIKYVVDHFDQYIKNNSHNAKPIPTDLLTLEDHFEDYIKNKEEGVAKDTVKDYRSLIKHLKAYEESKGCHLNFTSFDYYFYEDFVDFLFYETKKPNGEGGLLANSVGKQIKNLKCFLRNRIRKGYCANLDLSGYTTITEEVDMIFLTWQEIVKIYCFDLEEHPELKDTRNLLVLGCLTGLRYSDLSRISANYIQNNVLKIRQKKVQKFVQIPIINDTYDILKNYDFNVPKIHINDFNESLKVMGKLMGFDEMIEVTHFKKGKSLQKSVPKYELFTSHICRRSFCTNEYLRGTDPMLIRKISGHKTERAFLTYIKVDELMAAQKIAESWQDRRLA